MKQITETQLILPALIALSQERDYVTINTIKDSILRMLKPKKRDLTMVSGRNQTMIENRIENLVSHRTLEPFADYKKLGGRTYIRITSKGKTKLSKSLLNVD